jgi:short-subunit dehydrogenase involved in D-alanine esterification of teichoic acids
VVDQVARELGGLDLIVNNAGLLRGYPVDGAAAEANAAADINVNLLGAIRMTRLALPLLRRSDESAVVFISSAVALAAVPGFAVYAATKAGVHAFARSLRLELAESRIRVYEVLPPVVDTGPMRDVNVPKLSPTAVATAIVDGLRRDRDEIRVGAVRQLAPIARLMPRVADRIVTKALGQSVPPR